MYENIFSITVKKKLFASNVVFLPTFNGYKVL